MALKIPKSVSKIAAEVLMAIGPIIAEILIETVSTAIQKGPAKRTEAKATKPKRKPRKAK